MRNWSIHSLCLSPIVIRCAVSAPNGEPLYNACVCFRPSSPDTSIEPIWGMLTMLLFSTQMKNTTNAGIFFVCHRLQLTSIKERLLGIDNSRDDMFKLAQGRLFLVEAKCLCKHDSSLVSHMPEAVSQAIALAQLTRYARSD